MMEKANINNPNTVCVIAEQKDWAGDFVEKKLRQFLRDMRDAADMMEKKVESDVSLFFKVAYVLEHFQHLACRLPVDIVLARLSEYERFSGWLAALPEDHSSETKHHSSSR